MLIVRRNFDTSAGLDFDADLYISMYRSFPHCLETYSIKNTSVSKRLCREWRRFLDNLSFYIDVRVRCNMNLLVLVFVSYGLFTFIILV